MSISSPLKFNISPRPPTPPKDYNNTTVIDEVLNRIKDNSLNPINKFSTPSQQQFITALSTPPESSPSKNDDDCSSRSARRVAFNPRTTEHHHEKGSSLGCPDLRPLPSTTVKPLRSILKSNVCGTPLSDSDRSPSTSYFTIPYKLPFNKMLESCLKLLSSADVTLRLDGYQTLVGSLKAYANFPDEEQFREKLPVLCQNILRDLKLDTTLDKNRMAILQALKLVLVLFGASNLTGRLTNEFRAALLDSSIDYLGRENINKPIANNYMFLLSLREFNPRSLASSAKAEQLLGRLKDIHEKISGNSVIATRLSIYQRMIEHTPSIMLGKIRSWIEHIFHAALSNHEDLRKRAIECGLQAGNTFGIQFAATRVVVEVFAVETEAGLTYGQHFTARLADMAKDPTQRIFIPQILSVIIMFFRSKKQPLSAWQMSRPILTLIQNCFNSPELPDKVEATMFWNRLVYVVDLQTVTLDNPDHILVQLRAPFAPDLLARHGNDKIGLAVRRTTLFGYTNLLYYALQPAQSHDRLDFFWDLYVKDILPKLMDSRSKDRRSAERILEALMSTQTKAWQSDRATTDPPLRPQELPRIDPQWIRSRLPTVLKTFQQTIRNQLIMPTEEVERVSIWRILLSTISELSKQEVRSSMETREALAVSVKFICDSWTASSKVGEDSTMERFMKRSDIMVHDLLDLFGSVVFFEDTLTLGPSNTVQAVPATLHRSSKKHGTSTSAMLVIFEALVTLATTSISTLNPILVARTLLDAVEAATSALQTKLNILRKCMKMLQHATKASGSSTSMCSLCDAILATASKCSSTSESDVESETFNPKVNDNLLEILILGLPMQQGHALSAEWRYLYNSLSVVFREKAGGLCVRIAVMEPIARAAMSTENPVEESIKVQIGSLLLTNFTWVDSAAQLDRVYKSLESSHAHNFKRESSAHNLEEAFALVGQVLRIMTDIKACRTAHTLALLLTSLRNCPSRQLVPSIARLSVGLKVLLAMACKSRTSSEYDKLFQNKIETLWYGILVLLEQIPATSDLLGQISTLLINALTGESREVFNETVEYWNKTFGQAVELSYPPDLVKVLRALARQVDIDLPSFPTAVDVETLEDVRFPAMVESALSDQDLDALSDHDMTPHPKSSVKSLLENVRRHTPQPTSHDTNTAAGSHTPKSKAMPPPKLKHDNSQIEFVNITHLHSELTEDGTQSLTERQREVYERQQEEAARLFPMISSSPAPSSTLKNLIVERVTNSQQRIAAGRRFDTPEPENDDQAMIDTCMNSSPIVQSLQRAQSRSSQASPSREREQNEAVQVNNAEVDNVENDNAMNIDEVPSSPPEMPHELLLPEVDNHENEPEEDNTSVYSLALTGGPVTEHAEVPATTTSTQVNVSTEVVRSTGDKVLEADNAHNGDVIHPDDFDTTYLDDVSPMLQADNVETRYNNENLDEPTEITESAKFDPVEDPINNEHMEGQLDTLDTVRLSNAAITEGPANDQDLTTVADSFVVQAQSLTIPNHQTSTTIDAAPISDSTGSRKRKRPVSTTIESPRKRLSWLPSWMTLGIKTTSSQPEIVEDSDDDIQDCIVVATQPSPQMSSELDLDLKDMPQSTSQQETRTKLTPKHAKGKGSARRSNPRTAVSRSLKRKASHSSVISSSHENKTTTPSRDGENDDEPLSKRTRRQLRNQIASSPIRASTRDASSVPATPVDNLVVNIARLPSTPSNWSRVSGTVNATDILIKADVLEDEQFLDVEEVDFVTTIKATDEEDSIEDSPASPSMLSRLKNILNEVKDLGRKFVLGPTEAHEISRVLFELGHEVHVAGERKSDNVQ